MMNKRADLSNLWIPDDEDLAAVPIEGGIVVRQHQHIGCPKSWLDKVVKALGNGNGGILVALRLYHLHKVRKSRTVVVSNCGLADWGVSRFAKYRALARLQKAGIIEVRPHRNGHALEVRIKVDR